MNFQKDIKKIKRLASISEEAQELVKQITGKELVSYEGIDALVAALMGFYNAELKKKSQTGHKHTKEEITDFPSAMTPTAHNHDDRYYTENETNDKLKQKLNKGNLPATITDAKEIYNLLENNSGLNFDKNLLFLNDKGVKTQGKIYFDRNKVGMFECIKTTPEDYVANSTTYFVDISNKSSSDRLSNLVRIVKIRDTRFDEWILIPYPSGFSKDNSFCFGIQTETQNDAIDILKLNFDRTHYLVHQLTKDLTFNFDLCFIKI